jgi:hypothetical protein
MIGQMKVLLRVKELKQEQAFRVMSTKRQQFEEAKVVTVQALEIVRESAATMPAREDAIYADVLGRVVDLGEIDEMRGRVVQLEKDHGRLNDAWERAAHVEARLEGELEKASTHYKRATKVRDKYVILTDTMVREEAEITDQREEAEIEDLFARPKRRIG